MRTRLFILPVTTAATEGCRSYLWDPVEFAEVGRDRSVRTEWRAESPNYQPTE